MSQFDSYAHDYDQALNQGLSVSGEDKTYFARGRILWLARCLQTLGVAPRVVLDYGCGTGTSTPLFFDILGAERVVGVDLSPRSLDVARRNHAGLPVEYKTTSDHAPGATADLAFCNGVFHHVPPSERGAAYGYIVACLRPGGLLALWENNPWNPGTRYIMSRIPFDKDAILVSAGEAAAAMRRSGLCVLRQDYYFVFPRFARALRFLEPGLARLPLGAQYQVLGRKPG